MRTLEKNEYFIEDDGKWNYCVYIMDGFYNKAVHNQVILGKDACKVIDTWAFTIHTDAAYACQIFYTNVIDDVGTLEGEFYFLPGRYYLNNAVTLSKMDEIIMDIG